MKALNKIIGRSLTVALMVSIGFASGFFIKDLTNDRNSARASEAAVVPVQKVQDGEAGKVNHMIAPNLWDVYIDPLFLPISWTAKPIPLLPLMTFPTETPKMQTINGENELRLIAQVPGMNEKDVKVEASESTVTIKAHKTQEEKKDDRFETFDESFEQSVHLPCKIDADKVKATVKDGVLTVTLPKS